MRKFNVTALLLAALSFCFTVDASAADKRGVSNHSASIVPPQGAPAGTSGRAGPHVKVFNGASHILPFENLGNQQTTLRPGNQATQPGIKVPGNNLAGKPGIIDPRFGKKIPKVTLPADLNNKVDLGKITTGRPDFGKIDLGKGNNGKINPNNLPSNARPRFDVPKTSDLGSINPGNKLNLGNVKKISHDLPRFNLSDRLKAGDFEKLADSKIGKQIDLSKQLQFHQHGDAARRLDLVSNMMKNGGWHKRFCGVVDPFYSQHCFGSFYCGGGWYPGYCWFPNWAPWVDWCWHCPCVPVCDPRPIYCRPIYCTPCDPWVVWDYPVWCAMPVVTCGTWVDVEPIAISQGYDIQLLAVRFVDAGHPEKELGPRYRFWVRNNSPVAVPDFNLLAYASNERIPAMGMPEAGVRVANLGAGQIQSFDVRLPFAASTLDRDDVGRKVPFKFLHVVADSHREIPEAFEDNNGAVLDRRDIFSVDPALLGVELSQNELGPVVNLAGEGFGPEPGQVLVSVNGVQLQGEITGWYDLGVQIKLPQLSVVNDLKADLIVVRGDRAASNPMPVSIAASAGITSTVPVAAQPQ